MGEIALTATTDVAFFFVVFLLWEVSPETRRRELSEVFRPRSLNPARSLFPDLPPVLEAPPDYHVPSSPTATRPRAANLVLFRSRTRASAPILLFADRNEAWSTKTCSGYFLSPLRSMAAAASLGCSPPDRGRHNDSPGSRGFTVMLRKSYSQAVRRTNGIPAPDQKARPGICGRLREGEHVTAGGKKLVVKLGRWLHTVPELKASALPTL